jgi:hypothetical protein
MHNVDAGGGTESPRLRIERVRHGLQVLWHPACACAGAGVHPNQSKRGCLP